MPDDQRPDRIDELEDHDRGLRFDVVTLGRRRMLALAGGAGVAAALLAACGSNGSGSSSTTGAASTTAGTTGSTTASTPGSTSSTAAATTAAPGQSTTPTPEETGGPFPADGTNGVNVLDDDGIVRSDIRSSFGSSSGTAGGVPLTIDLNVVDAGTGAALEGAAVYIWHCTQAGGYSLTPRASPTRTTCGACR